jgi:CRP/FNR family transcriptional regulator
MTPLATREVLAGLEQVPFLAGLPPAALDAVRRGGSVRTFRRGELLFLAGDAPKGLFVVLRGSIQVYQIGSSGRAHVLAVEGPGSSVAELPLFDGGPYPAYAEATEDAVVFTLSVERFEHLLREHPQVARRVIQALAGRLRRLVRTVEELALMEVRQRVAALLVDLCREHGPEFSLPGSIEQVAARLGSVREVVSRALHGFAHDGLIRLEGRRVVVTDPEGLRERT